MTSEHAARAMTCTSCSGSSPAPCAQWHKRGKVRKAGRYAYLVADVVALVGR